MSKRDIQAGLCVGLFSALSFVFFIIGISLAVTPAYPAMISMLVPVWLLVYHKARGQQDNSSPYAGAALVFGMIIFVLST